MNSNDCLVVRYENIIIVGTAHLSEKNALKVLEIIKEEKPDVVAVELCEKRLKRAKMLDVPIFELLRRGEFFSIVYQVIASEVQRELGKKFNIIPGSEMLNAVEIAKKNNIKIELIDRDIDITIGRLSTTLNFVEKLKLIFDTIRGISASKDELKKIMEEIDINKFINEIKTSYPKIYKILIDERDRYMAYKLLKIKDHHKKVVAIVGKGHVPGILKYLKNPDQIGDINSLLEFKRKKGLKLLFVIILILILLFLIYKNIDILYYSKIWFINNFVPTFILVLIARGHILTALLASSLAPITSLLPFISAGLIALIVESYLRKISIRDILELIREEKLRKILKNKAFKVLLVSLFATIGSLIGTLISIENVIIPIIKELL